MATLAETKAALQGLRDTLIGYEKGWTGFDMNRAFRANLAVVEQWVADAEKAIVDAFSDPEPEPMPLPPVNEDMVKAIVGDPSPAVADERLVEENLPNG